MKKKVLVFVAIFMLCVSGMAYANNIYCQICNTPMHWTGRTYMDWGKMFKVYECLNGHQALVR